jgi:hypothetical protein
MNTTIAKIAWLCLAAIPALAHGGFDHVMGTVVQVSKNVLTVKTAKGNVDVKLDDKTELTKNDQKAQRQDLIPGARVVIDIPEGNKEMLAHSVKIGASAKTAVSHTEDSHAHDSH